VAREQRKLAAILAADVAGYSRLMGRNESGTLARLQDRLKERLELTLARYDGWLVDFASAVDVLSASIGFRPWPTQPLEVQPAMCTSPWEWRPPQGAEQKVRRSRSM
jgi:hypothetical protein